MGPTSKCIIPSLLTVLDFPYLNQRLCWSWHPTGNMILMAILRAQTLITMPYSVKVDAFVLPIGC